MSRWRTFSSGIPAAWRRPSSTVPLEASISIVSSPESGRARLDCALSPLRASPVPRKVRRLKPASPERCSPSPSFTVGAALVVGSSLMYALRITQEAGGREHIIQQILKRFTNRPYQQTASKDATNYLTAFTKAEFRDSNLFGSTASGRLHLGAEHRGTKNGLAFDLGAFDLDGTVLRRNLMITQGTVAALQSLRDREMRLVVATGRRFEEAREYAGRLGFADHDPLICYGGSMIRRMNGETLLHRKLPGSLGIEVLEWAAAQDLHARVFLDGCIITSPDTPAALDHLRRYA